MKHFSPILFVKLKVPHGKKGRAFKTRMVKALIDSGASESIIELKAAKNLSLKTKASSQKWQTAAGNLQSTMKTSRTSFSFPELHANKQIEKSLHVVEQGLLGYDMIIGQDLITHLGLDTKGSDLSICWDDAAIPWRDMDATLNDAFLSYSPTHQPPKRTKRILDAEYKAADLSEIVAAADHLNDQQKSELFLLLNKYKGLLDGTLGTWTGTPYDIKVKDGAEPYHGRPFPVPKIHELTLKTELDRLVKLGVLKKVNRSQWGAPTFIIPKKDATVRFISDFCELNKRIKREPYPIPKIKYLLLRLEGFTYGTSLDLNMGYYHITLSDKSKEMCTITTQWGKYKYQRLPMGLCNSPDIFQEKMLLLLEGLDSVRVWVYIDDVLHVDKGTWKEHLTGLDEILSRVQSAGLKVNARKSFFGVNKLEYLGYAISTEGISPISKKVEALKAIQQPKTRRQLRRFIGMINYYWDMWKGRSMLLAPLTALTSKGKPFKWEPEHTKCFDAIKRVIGREVLLAYPDFNAPFEIHTDASKSQLGAVISQGGKSIAFFSRKLNSAQLNYTVTEK
jgi:hypothetical protein